MTNPCCPKCKGLCIAFADIGKTNDCPCHSPASPIGWEESFDELWRKHVLHLGYANHKDEFIKTFIRQTLSQEREKIAGMVEDMSSQKYTWKTGNLLFGQEDECKAWNKALTDASARIREGNV